MADVLSKPKLHIAMYPLIAVGHITAFILTANELAARGHSVSFLLPNKAIKLLGHHNLHPHLVKFYPVTIPHVDGLPPGAETTNDIEITDNDALTIAFDATADQVEALLLRLNPDMVFYDFAHWIPDLAHKLGFKSIFYSIVSATGMAFSVVPGRPIPTDRPMTDDELLLPPEGYPSSTVVLRRHEARQLSFIYRNYGAIPFAERISTAISRCDAVGIRTCRELEGPMCDYIGEQYKKPVFLSGPVMPAVAPSEPLAERWDTWLSKFEPQSVVYCSFGSQTYLNKEQFQEMMLGFEMMGRPFLVAVPKPQGAETMEEFLPEGFLERVGERGVVHGGWVQQTQILKHPSVGCFVSHGGISSIWEWMATEAQIVFLPWMGDQIFISRLMAEELKMGVEVARGEKRWFSKEDLSAAVRAVMDAGSEVGELVRANHSKWKAVCCQPEFQDNYVDNFIQQLYHL